MKRITYSGETFFVSDNTAAALLDLGAALSRRRESATVQVPSICADGDILNIHLLMSSTSVLVAIPVASTVAEPDDAVMVAGIRRRIAALAGPRISTRALPFEDALERLSGFDGDVHGPFVSQFGAVAG
ncbi:MAG: hypothetical protein JWQ43_2173 [Glaciihabitans sp.]|nr:hypothetical protein [Glaciihabitans sp.]